jgi:hypothetical protein
MYATPSVAYHLDRQSPVCGVVFIVGYQWFLYMTEIVSMNNAGAVTVDAV